MLGMRASTDAHLYGDPNDSAIPALLHSRFDGDKFDALNHLPLISEGVAVAHLSPQAVKNLAARLLKRKKLVSSTSTCSTRPRDDGAPEPADPAAPAVDDDYYQYYPFGYYYFEEPSDDQE